MLPASAKHSATKITAPPARSIASKAVASEQLGDVGGQDEDARADHPIDGDGGEA